MASVSQTISMPVAEHAALLKIIKKSFPQYSMTYVLRVALRLGIEQLQREPHHLDKEGTK